MLNKMVAKGSKGPILEFLANFEALWLVFTESLKKQGRLSAPRPRGHQRSSMEEEVVVMTTTTKRVTHLGCSAFNPEPGVCWSENEQF